MSVKIGKIAQAYIASRVTVGKLHGLHGQATSDPKSTTPHNSDQRFKSPSFRKAVRTVLCHLDYSPTFANFKLHDKQYGAVIPFNWYAFARNIANSSFTRVDGTPTQGVYFETHTGALIEMGKCLESINELTEYNRRLKK